MSDEGRILSNLMRIIILALLVEPSKNLREVPQCLEKVLTIAFTIKNEHNMQSQCLNTGMRHNHNRWHVFGQQRSFKLAIGYCLREGPLTALSQPSLCLNIN